MGPQNGGEKYVFLAKTGHRRKGDFGSPAFGGALPSSWALGEQFAASVPKPRWVKTLGWLQSSSRLSNDLFFAHRAARRAAQP